MKYTAEQYRLSASYLEALAIGQPSMTQAVDMLYDIAKHEPIISRLFDDMRERAEYVESDRKEH